MSEQNFILPVVIVGKDRTRMTCAVIDHIKEHVKNAKPFFICVSDRSRPGHDIVVENHLKEIGETEYQVLRTLPEENRFGWGCAINLGLQCAFDVCNDSKFALVVDNDWLLQKDLDIDKYAYAFEFSNIGAITFKPVHQGTNVLVTETTLSDGSTYLKRSQMRNGRYSFTAEIGCMLITKRMVEEYGQFKENCRTDETEWAFCNWYNDQDDRRLNVERIWFATDRELFHTELNGEGHVFTHVGLHSQHEGPHKWEVPEQYLYLSDEDADAKVCHDSYWIPVEEFQRNVDLEVNFWKRNKVLFATNFSDDKGCPLRLSYEILKNIAGEGDVYVSKPSKFGRDAFFDIFSFAIEHGYEYVVYSDADNFIVSEDNLRAEFEDFLKDGELMFSGPTDGGTIFHRNGSAFAINPFLLFVRLARIMKYYDKNRKKFKFPDKKVISSDKVSAKTKHSSAEAIASWREYRRKHGFSLQIADEIARGTDNHYVRFWFGRKWKPWSVDESLINKEPYYDIFLGACKDGGCNQYMYACDYVFDADTTGITSAIFHFDRGAKERDYGDESKLICIHTWFARVFLKTPDTGNDDQRNWQIKRIEGIVSWVKERIMNVKIDWEKYFDRVFCLMLLDELQNRRPRLEKELERVGLLESPVFEWRYDVATPLDDAVTGYDGLKHIEKNGYKKNIYNYARIMKESLLLGYKRILIIEDDIAFLKDKREIVKALEALPSSPIVQMSKFVNFVNIEVHEREVEKAIREGKKYFKSQVAFHDASCNVFSREGMQICFDVLTKEKVPTDWIGHVVPDKISVATKNLSVQVLYKETLGFDSSDNAIRLFHDLYRRQGIDEFYSEYAVPEGYNMSSVYEEKAVAAETEIRNGDFDKCKPVKKGRKFVSVYAIAKNEAEFVERWYNCVKEADEVCVLVNNSTDGTAKKLRGLGAYVVEKNYSDWSFAVARNDSMALVSPESEILFTLDIDETISPGWRKKLEDAWIEEEAKGLKPVGCVYKYIWSFMPDGKEAQSFTIRKIHANGVGKWKYRCHELLLLPEGHCFYLDDFVVEHHQNRNTVRSNYLALLEKDAEEMPGDDRSAYYLARE